MKSLRFSLPALVLLIVASCNNQTAPPNAPQDTLATTILVPTTAQKVLDDRFESASELWRAAELAGQGGSGLSGIDSLYDVYAITFLWGGFAPLGQHPVDWSGTLTSSVAAALHVRATIDFDEGQDSLLRTGDSTRLEWVSMTTHDFDGLSLLVFVPKDQAITVLPELFFNTNAINLQWTFAELEHLTAFYPHPGLHNALFTPDGLVVHSRRLHPTRCPRGLMKGNWLKADGSHERGSFEGMWLNHAGLAIGHLNGIWWTTDDGARLLEGSVSGLHTDEVIAKLKGHWGYDDPRMCPLCGVGHGGFRGRIRMVASGAEGQFKGEFGDFSMPPNDVRMPFFGKWQLDCPRLRDGDLRASE